MGFDLQTFLRLTRAQALCWSLVRSWFFCQTVVLVCPLLLQEKQEARVKELAVTRFRKSNPEVDPHLAGWELLCKFNLKVTKEERNLLIQPLKFSAYSWLPKKANVRRSLILRPLTIGWVLTTCSSMFSSFRFDSNPVAFREGILAIVIQRCMQLSVKVKWIAKLQERSSKSMCKFCFLPEAGQKIEHRKKLTLLH